ncbi:hypothetical protein M513_12248 [Trichuris suis]|uniref:Uncharacterized protein n=1 Tax=Trichuris suis TaxID=68888 RepID=A0A085LPJ4_9BILA|nr:hypothetical protein M513_14071 [Trichuris suis]KFD46890.1 hypothetical protein M513_12248 [Trichuris suis]
MLMCWASSGRNHEASSIIEPPPSSATPRASPLASTQTLALSPETSHVPCAGSCFFTLAAISSRNDRMAPFSTGSFHVLVTALMTLLAKAAATLSQPHTGKWPTS